MTSTDTPAPGGRQVPVPCWFMRGGTSRGPFFRAQDLPDDVAARDRVLLSVMGSPDPRQIDGVGGGTSLTSKAGVVGPSERDGVDLEFRFAQLQPGTTTVDTAANCGNMLAAVVPFALESGLLRAHSDTTTARVLTLNTGMSADITVQTPSDEHGRYVRYDGTTHIDGVTGTAAPVTIDFLDTAGSVAASPLPTGRTTDHVAVPGLGEVPVTCIDNGMPLVLVPAAVLQRRGDETVEKLRSDTQLAERLEALRLRCGHLMGLGDVTTKNYPKMTLVAPPAAGGSVLTRSFIPHAVHDAIGVLAAVTVGTACVLPGTVVADLADVQRREDGALVVVEHPTGELTVELGHEPRDPTRITRSALVRTARLIMAGSALVPAPLASPETRRSR